MANTNQYRIIEDISYHGEGEAYWKLDLAIPLDTNKQTHPTVLFIHGGAWAFCTKKEEFESEMIRVMASRGYVAASIEYRLTGIAPFPAQFNDVRRAVRFLRGNAEEYKIDSQRIGVAGHSAGAHLSALLGVVKDNQWLDIQTPFSHLSGMVQAVAGLSGPYDLNSMYKSGLPWVMEHITALSPGPAGGLAKRLEAASPLTYVNPTPPPFLLIHGARDDVIPADQPECFLDALKQNNSKESELIIYKEADHETFLVHGIKEKIVDFFDKQFK